MHTEPDVEPLEHAAMVTGGLNKAPPAKVYDPGAEKMEYTEDLWPWVLLFVAMLVAAVVLEREVRTMGRTRLQQHAEPQQSRLPARGDQAARPGWPDRYGQPT